MDHDEGKGEEATHRPGQTADAGGSEATHTPGPAADATVAKLFGEGLLKRKNNSEDGAHAGAGG